MDGGRVLDERLKRDWRRKEGKKGGERMDEAIRGGGGGA